MENTVTPAAVAARVEEVYAAQTSAFAAMPAFRRLEEGAAPATDYRRFLANLFVTHFRSPRILAFLFSVAPPAGEEKVRHNLMEEMGLTPGEVAHPELLARLVDAAGFTVKERADLEARAQAKISEMVSAPLMFASLKEAGFSVLLEVSAFEWMLSRLSGRMGDMLAARMGLGRKALEWFYHHGEVDVRHAAEALEVIGEYAAHYRLGGHELGDILDITFRDNVFHRHYFGGADGAGKA